MMKASFAALQIVLALLTSTVTAGLAPTTDSFDWTLYDDFSDRIDSLHKWPWDGWRINLGTDYSLDGKMVLSSHASPNWGASGRYYAIPEEPIQGIKADISLKDNYYPGYGFGRNVVGIRVSGNLDVYMGFFSDGRTHNIQVGYRYNAQDVIPEGWSSQPLAFEQEYEVAMVLDDSGSYILCFLDNQLFDMLEIGIPSEGVSRFFIETDVESWLDTEFSIDSFYMLVPEPATLLLLGLGGVVLRCRNRNHQIGGEER